jgi:hypothetical protein
MFNSIKNNKIITNCINEPDFKNIVLSHIQINITYLYHFISEEILCFFFKKKFKIIPKKHEKIVMKLDY